MEKIALLVAHMSKGGMQKCMSNFSLALSDKVEHEILYFGTEEPGFPFAGKEINLDIAGKKDVGSVVRIFNFFKRIRRLRRYLKEQDVNVVVSFGEVANIVNVLVAKRRTVLAVQVDIMRSLEEGWYNRIYKLLVFLLYRRADTIVAISKSIAQDLVKVLRLPREKVVSLCNVYDFNAVLEQSIVPIPLELKNIFDSPVVINIANLNAQKGQKYLINAFQRAQSRISDLQLVIIGRGELEQELRQQVHDLNLDFSVHFLGFQANPYKYLGRSDVFVLSSLYEGIPTIVIESLLLGIPVISTDCKTGPREILGDSVYGILLPDINERNAHQVEQSMADSIISLHNDPEKHEHFVAKGKERARDFSPEIVLDKWLDILEILPDEKDISQNVSGAMK